jgi:hypothetical protein
MSITRKMVILPVHLELELYKALREKALKQSCSMASLARKELRNAPWNQDVQDHNQDTN